MLSAPARVFPEAAAARAPPQLRVWVVAHILKPFSGWVSSQVLLEMSLLLNFECCLLMHIRIGSDRCSQACIVKLHVITSSKSKSRIGIRGYTSRTPMFFSESTHARELLLK